MTRFTCWSDEDGEEERKGDKRFRHQRYPELEKGLDREAVDGVRNRKSEADGAVRPSESPVAERPAPSALRERQPK
jgi:hypothetical protein